MRAVVFDESGGPEVLRLAEVADPEAGPEDILVRNFAAGVNRADLLQRRGFYPPPAGAPELLGLEYAGEVLATGARVEGLAVGDRVFGLVSGGAYADIVAVDHRLVLAIPDSFSYEAAAAVPEAFLTAFMALFVRGQLAHGETVLVHAGASGVGTAAIQLARRAGARVIATAGKPEKVERCLELGARHAIDYRLRGFREDVVAITGGRGADLVLDFVGAPYWTDNVACLRPGGRLVLIGLLGGASATVDLGQILLRRLEVKGMVLRGLPLEEKIDLVRRFRDSVLPELFSGGLVPVLDRVFLIDEVRAAHERMESNLNVGKIVLRM